MSVNINTMRKVVLEGVSKYAGNSNLQPGVIVREAARSLGIQGNPAMEEALLTVFYDLFREGHLAWGFNASNAEPPFCHVTEQGRDSLKNLDRDPANPDGYMQNIAQASLNSIARSYLEEALKAYNSGCFKSAAVMVGAAAERMIIELRDCLVARIQAQGRAPSPNLADWKVKTIFDAMTSDLDRHKQQMPKPLRESYESFWQALFGQLRMTRNDAGHPTSIDPVTWDSVHSSLLIFLQFAKLAFDLRSWVPTGYN
jgi:hypothetical protein